MPSFTRVARIARLVTLPETRRAVLAAARSPALRDIAQRASTDRAGLLRDLRSPANARGLLRDAVRHPATRELADASLMFLPVRYIPLGWAASRAGGRVLRRFVDPPSEVIEPSAFGAERPLRNVTDPVAADVRPPAPDHGSDLDR
jgi:hypothetical protein